MSHVSSMFSHLRLAMFGYVWPCLAMLGHVWTHVTRRVDGQVTRLVCGQVQLLNDVRWRQHQRFPEVPPEILTNVLAAVRDDAQQRMPQVSKQVSK